MDFGFADVWPDGTLTKVALFVMTLPYSDAIFIQAFPQECTEAFLEALNQQLVQCCRNDLQRQLRGQSSPKRSLLAEEQREFLRPLPQQTFAACRLGQAHADSLSLVRFDTNSYSVPTKYAHRQITIVATIAEVRLVFEGTLIARHQRD
ncbi:hypothetical protein [Gimesia sp.]|uniref:Mu transposase domain-containing protein n=1 Tax=Gimesia sp. TaxID=2024833 RepID=UPI0032F06A0C